MTKTRTTKRDLSLDRKRPGGDPPLAIPKPTPVATPENSWLTYADPKGRFHFRHPQGFEPQPSERPNSINLKYFHADTPFDDIVGPDLRREARWPPRGELPATRRGVAAERRRGSARALREAAGGRMA